MSPLVIIFLTVFIDLLGFGIIIPLLPFYAESYGANAFTVGLLGTVYSLMQFTFAPVWGRWSDRIGRRPIILLGLIGSGVSYLALALAGSLMLIFAARILGGIAGANIPTAQAYIADITTPENRARGMGMVGAAFGLGFIFGPALGGILTHLGPSAPMWASSALCFANAAAAWLFLPESRPAAGARRAVIGRLELFRRSLGNSRLLLLLVLYFLINTAFSGFEATFAIFSERRFGFTSANIGYVFAFVGCVLALVQGVLVGRFVRLVGEPRLIPAALSIVALGLALVPLAQSIPMLLVRWARSPSGWASTTRRCRQWCRVSPTRTIRGVCSGWRSRSPASAESWDRRGADFFSIDSGRRRPTSAHRRSWRSPSRSRS